MLTLVGDTSGRPLLGELRRRGKSDLTSSLRLLGSGGSILSGETKDGLLEMLPSVLAISEAVGSSESPVQAVAIGQRGPEPSGSLRFAARAGATVVVDEDLTPVTPGSGEIGRLATSGYVPIGYYNDPVKSAETFVEFDGRRWSLPGDMATVDSDGTIRLLGRGSLCINTGGEKVYPEEVEAILKSILRSLTPSSSDSGQSSGENRSLRSSSPRIPVTLPRSSRYPPTAIGISRVTRSRGAWWSSPRSAAPLPGRPTMRGPATS